MARILGLVAAGLAGIVIGAGGYGYYMSKAIPEANEKALAAWSNVEKEFKARAELTPKMIAMVESINDTQKPLIEELKTNQAAVLALPANKDAPKQADGIKKFMQVQDGLSKQLGRIYDFLQYYPDRAREGSVRATLDELEKRESSIVVARRTYSALAGDVNTYLTKVPHSWVAKKLDPDAVLLIDKFDYQK